MLKLNMTSSRSLSLCLLASVFACSVASVAQRVAPAVRPAARIVSPIDESQRVSLSGNISPLANAQNDRGPVSRSLLIDVSPRVADELDMKRAGIVRVSVELVAPASNPPR